MDKMIFNQVIPRLRVLENKLLDKAKLDRMVDSPSASDAFRVLSETEYAGSMGSAKRAEDYEVVLSSELKRVYAELKKITPVKEVVDVVTIRYDYHNLKVLVKANVLNKDFSHMLIEVGSVDIDLLKSAVQGEKLRDLSPLMRKSVEEVLVAFEVRKDPQEVDVIFDEYMFREMLEISKKLNDPFLTKYVKSQVDLNNIKTLLRVKNQNKDREFLKGVIIKGGAVDSDKLMEALNDAAENLPGRLASSDYASIVKLGIEEYSKNGSLNLLDKLSDNYIMTMMKNAKLISFGLEPMLAYIYAKETEIKLIRIIMVGKLNNISAEVIRERLRDAYV